jgi:hypothetical protein
MLQSDLWRDALNVHRKACAFEQTLQAIDLSGIDHPALLGHGSRHQKTSTNGFAV